MRSATSYFNRELFRGTLQRTWPLWAAYTLAGLLLGPVVLFTRLYQPHIVYSKLSISYDILSMSTHAGIAAAAFSGIFFAMAMFSYLSNTRATYGLHAMPIRREGLFFTHYLAGLFPQAVSLVLVYLLAALVAGSRGVFNFYVIGTGLVIDLLLVVFFYSFGVLCMVCAGQVLAGAAFYGIFNVLFIAMEALIQTLSGNFLYGYTGTYSNFAAKPLTPVFQLYTSLRAREVWPETANGDILWDAEPIGVEVVGMKYAVIYTLVGLVLAALALLLYRSRKSEATGSTVAITWLRPVFKYGVALCTAFSLGQLLSYFVFELTESPYEIGALVGTVACMIFAGLLGYFAAEMLLKKSFRVFKVSWKGALATTVVLLLIGISFPLDLTGYQTYVPAQEEIAEARISIYSDGNINDYFELDEPESLALLRDAHYACILDKPRQTSVNRQEPQEHYCDFNLTYTLTDGTEVSRFYNLALTPEMLSDPSSPEAAVTALADCAEITQQRILGKKLPEDMETIRITGGELRCERYQDGSYIDSYEAELDAIAANNVFIALMQDCTEVNVATADLFSGRFEDRGYLYLYLWYYNPEADNDTAAFDGPATVAVNGSFDLRVTPEMTATVQTLREMGLIDMPF